MPFEHSYQSKASNLKYKILNIHDRITKYRRHYLSAFLEIHPEYNNREGIQKVRNVMSLVTADEKMTIQLEEFATKLENEAKTVQQ